MGDPAAGQPGGVYSVMQDPRLVALLVVLVASIVTAAHLGHVVTSSRAG